MPGSRLACWQQARQPSAAQHSLACSADTCGTFCSASRLSTAAVQPTPGKQAEPGALGKDEPASTSGTTPRTQSMQQTPQFALPGGCGRAPQLSTAGASGQCTLAQRVYIEARSYPLHTHARRRADNWRATPSRGSKVPDRTAGSQKRDLRWRLDRVTLCIVDVRAAWSCQFGRAHDSARPRPHL